MFLNKLTFSCNALDIIFVERSERNVEMFLMFFHISGCNVIEVQEADFQTSKNRFYISLKRLHCISTSKWIRTTSYNSNGVTPAVFLDIFFGNWYMIVPPDQVDRRKNSLCIAIVRKILYLSGVHITSNYQQMPHYRGFLGPRYSGLAHGREIPSSTI